LTKYKFDDNGRLLKRWWYCGNCEGRFYHWVEVCPACEREGVPLDHISNIPVITKWGEIWGHLEPSTTHSLTYNFNSYEVNKDG